MRVANTCISMTAALLLSISGTVGSSAATAAVQVYSAVWSVTEITGPFPTLAGYFTITFDPATVPFVNDIVTPTRDSSAGSLSFRTTPHRFDFFPFGNSDPGFLVGTVNQQSDSNNSLRPGFPDFRVRFILDDQFRLISARGGVGEGVGTTPFYGFDTLSDASRASFRLKIDGISVPVPEPASWAMLIAGFGLTGAAMRRRRAGVAAL